MVFVSSNAVTMEDYDFSSSHVLVYHVPIYNYGQILIDIRRVPFYAYDHVILNLVPGGMGNAPNNEAVDPVVMDIQHIMERRQRRLRRRHRFGPVNGIPIRRVYVSRSIQGIAEGYPIGLHFRPPNGDQNLAEGRANGVQQPAEDEGQGFAEPRANPQSDLMNGQQAPFENRMYFQHYLVNEGQISNGFQYQGAVNGEQRPMDHNGDYQQAPMNREQNPAGPRVANRYVIAGRGQAVERQQNSFQNGIWRQDPAGFNNNNANAGIFGAQAARGRVVVQNLPDQDGRISGRQNVSLGDAEDNGEQNLNSAMR